MEFCSPRAESVEVIRTRYNYTARWISRCSLATPLSVNRDAREISLKKYKILQSDRVKLAIDPAIDTLSIPTILVN